jgi:hypothetical protein
MVLVILTADQILRKGLLVVGFSDRRIQNDVQLGQRGTVVMRIVGSGDVCLAPSVEW